MNQAGQVDGEGGSQLTPPGYWLGKITSFTPFYIEVFDNVHVHKFYRMVMKSYMDGQLLHSTCTMSQSVTSQKL